MNETLFVAEGEEGKEHEKRTKMHSKFSHAASLQQHQQPKLCVVDAHFLELHTHCPIYCLNVSATICFELPFSITGSRVEIDNLTDPS